jgi:hypothetical protein
MACSSPHTHPTTVSALPGGTWACCHLARGLLCTQSVQGKACWHSWQVCWGQERQTKPCPTPWHPGMGLGLGKGVKVRVQGKNPCSNSIIALETPQGGGQPNK